MKLRYKFVAALMILTGCWLGRLGAQTLSGSNLELQSINANFANKTATLLFNVGQFVVTNKVLTNGDTVETNSFVKSGTTTQSLSGSIFSQIFGGLIQEQAVNIDAVTNATMGVTGVSIAGTDTTVFDVTANRMMGTRK